MVKPEPISPERPETSETAKFELIKAMGVAIAAIAKEKGVFITLAEVTGDEQVEMTIKCVIPEDKKIWDKYNEQKSKYNTDWTNWRHETDCEKYEITEEQRIEAENKYYEFRKETGYKYPESKTREDFYKEAGGSSQSPIIEVA